MHPVAALLALAGAEPWEFDGHPRIIVPHCKILCKNPIDRRVWEILDYDNARFNKKQDYYRVAWEDLPLDSIPVGVIDAFVRGE